MSAFDAASRALFRDRNVTQPADWQAAATGAVTSTRVILAVPDLIQSLSEAAVIVGDLEIWVAIAEVPQVQPGDLVTLSDSRQFEIRGEPLRDAHGLMWVAAAVEVA